MSEKDVLKFTLMLAISAPSEEKYKQVLKIANNLASTMRGDEVRRAKQEIEQLNQDEFDLEFDRLLEGIK